MRRSPRVGVWLPPLAPSIVLLGLFVAGPILWCFYASFTNSALSGIAARRPKFVGLDNFTTAFTSADVAASLWLTVVFVVLSAVVGQNGLGILLAVFMQHRGKVLRGVVGTVVVAAWVLPEVVAAFAIYAFLNAQGTLNEVLGWFGMSQNWLYTAPMLAVVLANIWRGTAFSMLLYSAALTGVPPSQLATARMFGANQWQQLRDVVFPHIRGHILTNLLLISLWTFNDFTPYQITAGGPDDKSSILPVYIYRTALFDGQMGLGAAISLLMLVINLVVALVYLRLLRERRLERAA